MSRVQWTYRDVSTLLQALRNFLLGRKHTLHPRFPCAVAPRSIPTPDIPRNPEYKIKYSKQYYCHRHSLNSVYPPVVTPVAMGSKNGTLNATSPTPGSSWWWDGHSYYECLSPASVLPDQRPPCPPAPPAPRGNVCELPPSPPCPLSPDKLPRH